jgi:UDP-N-acetyl-2-amino-2-deoxyglucuronate dehydrogenase
MKKVALVGCGRISKRHIEALGANKNIELSLVCDIDEKRAKDTASALNIEYVTDYKKIQGYDVISVCTPSGLHPDHVVDIARNCDSKYIVCEKPVSLTVREAVWMYKELGKEGKTLLPVYQNRYNPLVDFTRNLVKTGKLGTIYQFNTNVFWNRNDDYFKIDWHGTLDLDGGVLYTQASHYVDMLIFLFGKVKEAKGIGNRQRKLDVYDSLSAALIFECGAVGALNATVSVYRQNYMTEMTIIGDRGTVRLSGTNLNTIDFWDVEGMDKPDMDFKLDHVYGKGHDKMYEYVADGKFEMFPSYEDVIEGIALMERLSY